MAMGLVRHDPRPRLASQFEPGRMTPRPSPCVRIREAAGVVRGWRRRGEAPKSPAVRSCEVVARHPRRPSCWQARKSRGEQESLSTQRSQRRCSRRPRHARPRAKLRSARSGDRGVRGRAEATTSQGWTSPGPTRSLGRRRSRRPLRSRRPPAQAPGGRRPARAAGGQAGRSPAPTLADPSARGFGAAGAARGEQSPRWRSPTWRLVPRTRARSAWTRHVPRDSSQGERGHGEVAMGLGWQSPRPQWTSQGERGPRPAASTPCTRGR